MKLLVLLFVVVLTLIFAGCTTVSAPSNSAQAPSNNNAGANVQPASAPPSQAANLSSQLMQALGPNENWVSSSQYQNGMGVANGIRPISVDAYTYDGSDNSSTGMIAIIQFSDNPRMQSFIQNISSSSGPITNVPAGTYFVSAGFPITVCGDHTLVLYAILPQGHSTNPDRASMINSISNSISVVSGICSQYTSNS